MAKLKKSKLKTSKNLVTVAVVLTVASVVIYLLSLLVDGVLLTQIATLKNLIENGTWSKIFNPFIWTYRFIDVIDDLLSMSGIWLLVASAVIVWLKQKKRQMSDIWLTVAFGLNALGLIVLFGENFALKTVSSFGEVVARCLWAFPYLFAAILMIFLTVSLSVRRIPEMLNKVAAILSVSSMVLIGIKKIVDWAFDFAYTAATNTNALFDVSVVGFGDVLVTVSLLLVIVFSMVTLFAQRFVKKDIATGTVAEISETENTTEANAVTEEEAV